MSPASRITTPRPYSARDPEPSRPVVAARSRAPQASRARLTTPRGDLERQVAMGRRAASSVVVRDLATGAVLRVERCGRPGTRTTTPRVTASRQGRGRGEVSEQGGRSQGIDWDRLAQEQAREDALRDMRRAAGVHDLTGG